MHIRIHRGYRNLVAICDENIIGKKFEEGNRQLDVRESFYKDKIVSKEEAVKILITQLKEDATFNIVGQESIQTAIEAELISKDEVGKVSGIPFALKLV